MTPNTFIKPGTEVFPQVFRSFDKIFMTHGESVPKMNSERNYQKLEKETPEEIVDFLGGQIRVDSAKKKLDLKIHSLQIKSIGVCGGGLLPIQNTEEARVIRPGGENDRSHLPLLLNAMRLGGRGGLDRYLLPVGN